MSSQHYPRDSPRRTRTKLLVRALRMLFRKRANNPHSDSSIIVKRRFSLAPQLSSVSLLSLFPDFDSSQFDIDKYSVSSQVTLPLPPFFQNVPASQMLPACTLSQSSLHQVHEEGTANPFQQFGSRLHRDDPPRQSTRKQTRSPQVNQLTLQNGPSAYDNPYTPTCIDSVSPHVAQNAMQVKTPQPRSVRGHASKLRLRRDDKVQSPHLYCEIVEATADVRILRKVKGSRNRKSPHILSSISEDSGESAHVQVQSLSHDAPEPVSAPTSSKGTKAIDTIKYFRSFCVLDTMLPGNPITAISENLQPSEGLQNGEQLFLNIRESAKKPCDVIAAWDSNGGELAYLVLYSPLISPSTGQNRFVLASLVDITNLVYHRPDSRSIEGCEDGSEEDLWLAMGWELKPRTSDETLRAIYQDDLWLARTHEVREDVINQLSQASGSTDIWLAIADEENPRVSNPPNSEPWLNKELTESPQAMSLRSTISIDIVLDQFMFNLQDLYKDFFVLARNLDDDGHYYEICSVSPSVYQSSEYVEGHISRTPPEVLEKFARKLEEGSSFTLQVRWGESGVDQRLYCVPLFGKESQSWICLLVDPELPRFWN